MVVDCVLAELLDLDDSEVLEVGHSIIKGCLFAVADLIHELSLTFVLLFGEDPAFWMIYCSLFVAFG